VIVNTRICNITDSYSYYYDVGIVDQLKPVLLL